MQPVDLASVKNLHELARLRGRLDSDRIAFTFLVNGESEERHVTFGEMDREAVALAAKLQSLAKPGDRVLLLFDPGIEYLWAFFGVIHAGMIPVPAYPPDLMRAERMLPRLQALAEDCQPEVVLGTKQSLGLIGGLLGHAPDREGTGAVILTVDDRTGWDQLPWTPPSIQPDDICFLQYTSGSTSAPRGVMVTHANLLYQLSLLLTRWEQSYPPSGELGVVGISWLPMYHDLGLIGGILAPFYAGKRLVMMSPLAFIQRPIRWLKAISRYRPIVTGGPNFSFDLCVSKFRKEDAEGLDLSSLKIVMNGAEPVRAETLERFNETFAPYGWDKSAWIPSYGLAEATLGVTCYEHGARCPIVDVAVADLERNQVRLADPAQEKTRRLVGCGHAITGTEIRIVDPHTRREVGPDGVGEVWVRGLGVTRGYYNRPVENEIIFNARLAETNDGPFMRTGDYGFVHDGILYLTGRLKETMIFWGRNVYPQDIEQTVSACHEALRLNGGAAFAVEEQGQEQLVVMQEVIRPGKLDLQALASQVRQAVMAEHRVPLYSFVLIRPGSLPKTSSGKIQRGEARRKFLARELDIVAEWTFDAASVAAEPLISDIKPAEDTPDESAIKIWLRQRIAQAISVPPEQIAADEPLSHYVLDSITLVAIARDLELWLGRSIAPTILFDSPTLDTLARRLTDPAYYVATAAPGQVSVESLSEGELDQALARLLSEPAAGELDSPPAVTSPQDVAGR
jgi:acyl-CoA synthetase (AMP-forming)/AMP-acid ligase II